MRFVIALVISSLLVGCALFKKPEHIQESALDFENIEETGLREVNATSVKTPSLMKIRLPKDAFVLEDPVFPEIDKEIDVSFHNQNIHLILHALGKTLGFNVINSTDEIEYIDEELTTTGRGDEAPRTYEAQKLYNSINVSFKGNITDLLKNLSRLSGYFIVEEDNVIMVKPEDTFSVILPQYEALLNRVEGSIFNLGGREIAYDLVTSTLSFKCNYRSYLRIKEYLERLRDNANLVSLRVVLINLKYEDTNNKGIDWTKFVFGSGLQRQTDFGFRADAGTGDVFSYSDFERGFGLLADGTGASLFYEAAEFSISGFIQMMEKFGEVQIVQNIHLETLSGSEANLQVVTETPYIKSIGISPINEQNITSATDTDIVRAGVELALTPSYSKIDETLGLALNLKVTDFLRYIDLTAGSLGTFQQPEISNKTIKTFLRIFREQIAVIGGLKFVKSVKNASGLPGDTLLTKKYGLEKSVEEMVILIKPTIIEFEYK